MTWDQLLPSQFSSPQPDDKVRKGFRLLSNTCEHESKICFLAQESLWKGFKNLFVFFLCVCVCVYFSNFFSCVLLQEYGRLLPESVRIHANSHHEQWPNLPRNACPCVDMSPLELTGVCNTVFHLAAKLQSCFMPRNT